MNKKITLRLPVDLDNGNATNWLRESHGSLPEDASYRARKRHAESGEIPEWIEGNCASFLTLPEVRKRYEAQGYEVTFDLSV